MIDVTDDDGMVAITLNRPDKANALTAQMLADLRDAFVAARDARVVILTGAGRVFCAGADLDAARAGLATSPLWEEVSSAVANLRGLSIAALNGTLAGGAFGMVLACDMRIAVAAAKFFYPVMKLGFLPQPSDPARLSALIGAPMTRMILMGGQKIDAARAFGCGLIDEVVIDADVVDRARAICADTLAADPGHTEAIAAMISRHA